MWDEALMSRRGKNVAEVIVEGQRERVGEGGGSSW